MSDRANPGEEAMGQGDVVIYQSDDGETKIDVRFVGDTVWLTQAQLVQLFQTSKSNVSEHIKNIFAEGELDMDSVVRKFRTTAADGKSYQTKARQEYRKFQAKTLTPVETAYLETIKSLSRIAKKKPKKDMGE